MKRNTSLKEIQEALEKKQSTVVSVYRSTTCTCVLLLVYSVLYNIYHTCMHTYMCLLLCNTYIFNLLLLLLLLRLLLLLLLLLPQQELMTKLSDPVSRPADSSVAGDKDMLVICSVQLTEIIHTTYPAHAHTHTHTHTHTHIHTYTHTHTHIHLLRSW